MNARLLPAVAAGALPLLLAGPPVGAHGAGVAVSSDGVTWSSTLAAPLFDGSLRWVPGDDRTATFYLRNDSGRAVRISLQARDAGARRLTLRGDLRLSARTDGGPWRPLRLGAMSARLDVVGLAVGRVARIDVRGVLDPASPNRSQARETTVSLVLRLSDVRTGNRPAGNGPTGLSGTGAPDTRAPVLAGALLLGAGAALLRRRREVRHG